MSGARASGPTRLSFLRAEVRHIRNGALLMSSCWQHALESIRLHDGVGKSGLSDVITRTVSDCSCNSLSVCVCKPLVLTRRKLFLITVLGFLYTLVEIDPSVA